MRFTEARKRSRLEVGMTVVKKLPAPFSVTWLRKIIFTGLVSAGFRGRVEIGVVFTGNTEIRALNRQYRGRDYATDVLSFGTGESHGNLGDIIIAIPFVRSRAEVSGRSLRREVADLIIHGALHLIGYTHDRKKEAGVMFSLQDRAMKDAGYDPIDDRAHI